MSHPEAYADDFEAYYPDDFEEPPPAPPPPAGPPPAAAAPVEQPPAALDVPPQQQPRPLSPAAAAAARRRAHAAALAARVVAHASSQAPPGRHAVGCQAGGGDSDGEGGRGSILDAFPPPPWSVWEGSGGAAPPPAAAPGLPPPTLPVVPPPLLTIGDLAAHPAIARRPALTLGGAGADGEAEEEGEGDEEGDEAAVLAGRESVVGEGGGAAPTRVLVWGRLPPAPDAPPFSEWGGLGAACLLAAVGAPAPDGPPAAASALLPCWGAPLSVAATAIEATGGPDGRTPLWLVAAGTREGELWLWAHPPPPGGGLGGGGGGAECALPLPVVPAAAVHRPPLAEGAVCGDGGIDDGGGGGSDGAGGWGGGEAPRAIVGVAWLPQPPLEPPRHGGSGGAAAAGGCMGGGSSGDTTAAAAEGSAPSLAGAILPPSPHARRPAQEAAAPSPRPLAALPPGAGLRWLPTGRTGEGASGSGGGAASAQRGGALAHCVSIDAGGRAVMWGVTLAGAAGRSSSSGGPGGWALASPAPPALTLQVVGRAALPAPAAGECGGPPGRASTRVVTSLALTAPPPHSDAPSGSCGWGALLVGTAGGDVLLWAPPALAPPSSAGAAAAAGTLRAYRRSDWGGAAAPSAVARVAPLRCRGRDGGHGGGDRRARFVAHYADGGRATFAEGLGRPLAEREGGGGSGGGKGAEGRGGGGGWA